MKKLLLLLLAMMLCLTACQSQQPTAEPTATPEPTPELRQEEIVNYMMNFYVNEDSLTANYPVEYEIKLPGRTFLCETPVSNPAERLAYEYFYASGTGDYEYIIDRTVGSNIRRGLEDCVKLDTNGLFYENVVLHEMMIVPIEDFFNFQYTFCEEVATLGGTYGFSEYTVVKAQASYRHNDLYHELNPEAEDGEVVLYFFVGRTDGEYVLVEIYGEDYVK